METADAYRTIHAGEDGMAKEAKAKATRKPAAPRMRTKKAATPITRADIERRAYQLHLDGSGDELGNWLRAERELVTA